MALHTIVPVTIVTEHADSNPIGKLRRPPSSQPSDPTSEVSRKLEREGYARVILASARRLSEMYDVRSDRGFMTQDQIVEVHSLVSDVALYESAVAETRTRRPHSSDVTRNQACLDVAYTALTDYLNSLTETSRRLS
jgi:hypothetical protein